MNKAAAERQVIVTWYKPDDGIASGEPAVHAHWFTLDPNRRTGKAYKFACSNCERVVFTSRQKSINELGYVFCPHCGAKME